jgi:hypothetical protein
MIIGLVLGTATACVAAVLVALYAIYRDAGDFTCGEYTSLSALSPVHVYVCVFVFICMCSILNLTFSLCLCLKKKI